MPTLAFDVVGSELPVRSSPVLGDGSAICTISPGKDASRLCLLVLNYTLSFGDAGMAQW